MSYNRNNKRSNRSNRNYRGPNRNDRSRKPKYDSKYDDHNGSTLIVRDWKEKDKFIKDAIFAFSGGQKSVLIKGEGNEISVAVEIAETLKKRLYPGIEIAEISLGSRPFYDRNKNNRHTKRYNDKNNFKKDFVSKIEILLKTKSIT